MIEFILESVDKYFITLILLFMKNRRDKDERRKIKFN